LGAKQVQKHLSTLVGKTLPVLMEKGNKGRTPYFSEVAVSSDVKTGSLVDVKLHSVGEGCLAGELA
jgi:tRNA A37 methylthiotransferase MiaB